MEKEIIDMDMKNSGGMSAIHQAAAMGHHEIVKILVEAGVDINDRDNFNQTVAHFTSNFLTFKV